MHQHKTLDTKPINELQQTNYFDNALVVVSNSIARAENKWTIEELKMFYMIVSRVSAKDKNNWLTLKKADISAKLGYDYNHTDRVRTVLKSMAIKSYLQLDGYLENDWFDGFAFTNFKSNKSNVSVQFNPSFLPLIEQLSSHFTEFYLDCIIKFNHKSSIKLYTYLTSWSNFNYFEQHQILSKSDIAKVFDLKEGQYWRDYGQPNQKFDWSKFETRVLAPAIKEINEKRLNRECDLDIDNWKKCKKNDVVLGYEFTYAFRDRNGEWNYNVDEV